MSTTPYPRPFGPYVLLERLGQGGMSEVDLARRAVDDAAFVRFVVIKRIHAAHSGDDSFVRMFHDEARINAELQHENIATVYDFGQEGDEFFLAMEYVAGCDLRRVQRLLVRKGDAFPLRVALRIVADVLAALDYAHGRVDTYGRSMNIVHRDVNPRNIMLSVRGEVKLIDFGVAKADNRAEHTVGHSLKGKFAYMAPEQIEATRPVDGRADVFAVGIVLHELLTNASPFAGLTEVQTMHRILAGQIPAVSSHAVRALPPTVVAIHDRALATDPDQRFASAGEMRDAIVAAAQELGGLCSRAELAGFLRQVDPDASSVSMRLEEWRGGTPAERSVSRSRSVVAPPPAQVSHSGTLSTHAPPPPRRGGLARAAAVGGVVGMVLLLATSALLLRRPDGGPTAGHSEGTTAAGAPPVATPLPLPTSPTGAVASDASGTPAATGTAGGVQATGRPSVAAPTGAPSPDAPLPASSGAAPPTATVSAGSPDAPTSSGAASTAPDAPASSTGAPEPDPAPAAPTSAGSASAAAPPEADGPSPAAGSGADPGTSAASPAAAPAPSGATGFLNISSRPTGLELSVDGRTVGRTPLRALELPVGSHTVVARDPATGRTWQKQVQVEQGRGGLLVLGDSE